MRIKININQLKQVNPTSSEITLKEKEIELINKKIEDSNNTIENNNNIKNKYVNVAESAYNILLRKDNFPQYFYIEICNKLGVRINYEEHFIRDYNNERISVVDGVIKKEFTNDIDRDNAMINKKTNQKARYVPPCFRQQTQEENIKEESIESEEEVEEVEEKESFPTLNKNTSFNSKPLITSIWSNKPNIKEVVKEEVKENINTVNTNYLHESNNDEDNWFI
jgi:Rieske Fe-S protein